MSVRLIPVVAVLLCASLAAREATAGGGIHSCTLTAGGGVQCWGDNRYGQLGDGTAVSQGPTPVQVSGLTSGVSSVANGFYHSCAITSAGALRCWGYNGAGQLGDGTTENRSTPVGVTGLASGVTAAAGGLFHTCAVQAGALKCWGDNTYGQLGNNTTGTTPVTPIASGVVAVAAGDHHTCAVTTAGALRCWGRNNYGQVGDNSEIDRPSPVTVIASGVSTSQGSIAAGGWHGCAVQNGAAKCWGYNVDAQLGDGTHTTRLVPTQVSGLTSGIASVTAGYAFTCARTTGGGVRCWGYNYDGQAGDGSLEPPQRTTPSQVSGLSSGVTSVTAGSKHVCAAKAGNQVACLGDNGWSQLGEGTQTQRLTPTPVSGLGSGVAALSAGTYHMCGVTTAGGAMCWGNNSYGGLGYPTSAWAQPTPTPVTGLASGVASVVTGFFHSCALLTNGGVSCWGQNVYGQLGTGQLGGPTPRPVNGIDGRVSSLTAGEYHTCAVATGQGVRCWGSNTSGQLGDGTQTQRPTPTPVSGLGGDVIAVAAGQSHTCALTAGGGVRCWGENSNGQLGDGTQTSRPTPTPVVGLTSGVAAITAGYYHTCALTTTGAVRCWGDNGLGQLGDGTGARQSTPTPVSGLSSGVAAIAAGLGHTCALITAGEVRCWGFNGAGRLGDGTTTNRLVPTPVSSLGRNIASISAGQHTCAVTEGGAGYCWGDDAYGQLGMGTRLFVSSPLGVYGLGGTISVDSVSPASGATSGGTLVTITGDYFLPGASVSIGGTPASSVRMTNSRALVVTTGARSAGVASVTVTNPDGRSATKGGHSPTARSPRPSRTCRRAAGPPRAAPRCESPARTCSRRR